jgi:hypothetical protein
VPFKKNGSNKSCDLTIGSKAGWINNSLLKFMARPTLDIDNPSSGWRHFDLIGVSAAGRLL